MIKKFAALSQRLINLQIQIETWKTMYCDVLEERKGLIYCHTQEAGVYNVPNGHVVVCTDGTVTYYPEKT